MTVKGFRRLWQLEGHARTGQYEEIPGFAYFIRLDGQLDSFKVERLVHGSNYLRGALFTQALTPVLICGIIFNSHKHGWERVDPSDCQRARVEWEPGQYSRSKILPELRTEILVFQGSK